MRRSSAALAPIFCFTCPVARSMITSAASPSATAAARRVPSGLTVDDMILPSLTTVRLPYGLMYWSLEMTWPLAVVWPTCWVPKRYVEATAVPVTPRAMAIPVVTSSARRPTCLPKRVTCFFSLIRRWRITCTELFPSVGVEQLDVAVELPQRIRGAAGRSPHQEVAVDLLGTVAVRHEPPVRGDVELVDRRPR